MLLPSSIVPLSIGMGRVTACALRGWKALSLRSPFSPAQTRAIFFHPADPPIASQSFTRDVRFAQAHPANAGQPFSPTDPPIALQIVYPARALFPGGDGETPGAKIRSDGVRGGPSWRSRAAAGPCGHTVAEAGVTPRMPYYFVNSLTRWPSSGRMSFSIARRTAFSEPGVEKSTRPLMMPAVARLMMAAEPIS
jgi:hypothetical protein